MVNVPFYPCSFFLEYSENSEMKSYFISFFFFQIKRILRKRHTLPHYKMRYKPFFSLPEELIYQKDLSVKGNLIGQGQLEVKVIGCSRLLVEPANHFLFCTLSVGKYLY